MVIQEASRIGDYQKVDRARQNADFHHQGVLRQKGVLRSSVGLQTGGHHPRGNRKDRGHCRGDRPSWMAEGIHWVEAALASMNQTVQGTPCTGE